MRRLSGPVELEASVGTVLGTGEWLDVPQESIDAFARVTHDEQWLHVDPERAAAGPYGTTIAHGYLLLSLLPALAATAYAVDGVAARINYGLEKVRFPSPVPSDSRVRVTATLASVTPTDGGARIVVHNVVEAEGVDKPACIADTVSLLVFARRDADADEERSEG